jgi:uncharacterized repeat protein (TIGR03803 family)
MNSQPQYGSFGVRSWLSCFANEHFRCVAALLFCALIPTVASAQTLTTLVNFSGSNGASPLFAKLVQGKDGNFYGTTSTAGAHGQGTVFRITPQGVLTTLYSFCAKSGCTDGAAPYAGLILAKDGNFYGTTEAGGSRSSGTVFKTTPQGKLTTLHTFTFNDGAYPYAALVQAGNGSFYGTTESGGANLLGTVFKMTPQGVLTTLHSFNSTDGASPESPLIQATDGRLYGTTYNGGQQGYGTIFRMTPAGTLTTLHIFSDETEGRAITSGLVQSRNGIFYGSTTLGGPNGYGAVFSMTPSGSVTVLHSFAATDGATPNALVQGSDGNFYGTTIAGGAGSNGTIFEVTPQGAFSTLHTFTGSDGGDSFAGLVQGSDGRFYGTTRVGGAQGDGTVFALDLGLGPLADAPF